MEAIIYRERNKKVVIASDSEAEVASLSEANP